MVEGLRSPPTAGVFSGEVILPDSNDPTRIPIDEDKTGSVAIRAWDNQGVVYVGWTSEVDQDSGFPLEDGQTLSLDIDLRGEDVWMVPEVEGDSVRVISTN